MAMDDPELLYKHWTFKVSNGKLTNDDSYRLVDYFL